MAAAGRESGSNRPGTSRFPVCHCIGCAVRKSSPGGDMLSARPPGCMERARILYLFCRFSHVMITLTLQNALICCTIDLVFDPRPQKTCLSSASNSIFTLATPAQRRWRRGKRSREKAKPEFPKKPPVMAVFLFPDSTFNGEENAAY